MLQPVAFEAAISLISGVLPILSMKPDRTSMACSLCFDPALPGRTVDRHADLKQPAFRPASPRGRGRPPRAHLFAMHRQPLQSDHAQPVAYLVALPPRAPS